MTWAEDSICSMFNCESLTQSDLLLRVVNLRLRKREPLGEKSKQRSRSSSGTDEERNAESQGRWVSRTEAAQVCCSKDGSGGKGGDVWEGDAHLTCPAAPERWAASMPSYVSFLLWRMLAQPSSPQLIWIYLHSPEWPFSEWFSALATCTSESLVQLLGYADHQNTSCPGFWFMKNDVFKNIMKSSFKNLVCSRWWVYSVF